MFFPLQTSLVFAGSMKFATQISPLLNFIKIFSNQFSFSSLCNCLQMGFIFYSAISRAYNHYPNGFYRIWVIGSYVEKIDEALTRTWATSSLLSI